MYGLMLTWTSARVRPRAASRVDRDAPGASAVSSGPMLKPNQPWPRSATRFSAASLSPPKWIGGCGCWIGLGIQPAGAAASRTRPRTARPDRTSSGASPQVVAAARAGASLERHAERARTPPPASRCRRRSRSGRSRASRRRRPPWRCRPGCAAAPGRCRCRGGCVRVAAARNDRAGKGSIIPDSLGAGTRPSAAYGYCEA